MVHQGLLEAFGSHAFLRGLSDRHLTRLALEVRPFAVFAGDFLAREGEPAKAFYLIQAGRVEIGHHSDEGEFESIVKVGPGEVVGWSWLLPPHVWQFDCRAADIVQGLKFDAEWLREQCEDNHELGYHLLRHLLAVVAHRLAASRLAASRPEPLVHP